MKTTTSRRTPLKAAPPADAPITSPRAAAPDGETPGGERYTCQEYEAGRKGAEEIAYLHVARAWMDRWKALGGDVGLTFDRDLKPMGVHRGMLVALELWTPTDQGREDIPPHTWLVREDLHDGAVKALEGLLELVPGLKDAVREIAGREAFGRWAAGREA